MKRERMIAMLDGGPWDVIVIGGGATGLGVAVDAQTRGYRTLLLEAYDHPDDRVLVIGQYLKQLRRLADRFDLPLITGQTPNSEREELYERIYCARGEMENRIKECQTDMFPGRTSAATRLERAMRYVRLRV